MSYDRPLISLEDLTDGTTITYGVVKPGEDSPDGVLFIRGGDIVAGQINASQLRTISKDVSNQYSRTLLRGGELLISLVGNPGEVALVPDTLIGANIARQVGLVRIDPSKADSNYIQFFLRSKVGRDVLLAYSKGSVQQVINLKDLKAVKIPLPELSVQRKIATSMQAIDDRITLLRETNATLEAIAQALFKSWFVDFDPVRAKSEGKPPEGINETTAALFPDAFEETELGMVPKGWQFLTLSSLAAFQNGYAFKANDWVEQGHPVIKIGNVKPLLIDFEGCSYVSPETVSALDRFKLGRGDLLVGMTGYVGETGLVTSTEVASYLNQRVGRIVTSQGLDDLGFVFAAVRQAEFKAYAESQSHGSAQANVSGADLMKFAVVVPSAQVLNTFNQLVGKLIEKILGNYEEAKTLANLRDTLLPRLISRQLRIADAEAELDKVTA